MKLKNQTHGLPMFQLGAIRAAGFASMALLLALPGIFAGNAAGGPQDGPFALYGYYFLHDPGTLIKQSGRYFIWGDGQGISGLTTTDLRNWSSTSPIFPGSPPAWTTNAVPGFTGYNWAPDVVYFNGQYNLYYVCSIFGTINSAIGLVTSPSLISPVWTDQGKVIQSNPDFATNATTDLTSYNCIDPSVMLDTNGTLWMSFGSYSDGILIMQLDPTTGKRISPTSTLYRVANNGPVFFSNTEEGTCLYQRGGYYYLFCNWGGCCAGVNSTYNIRVGRSTTVTGPYYDKNGVNLVNGGGTLVLESTGRYIGPGQAAIMNDNGTNWFTYHYYDGNNNGDATVALMQLNWTADGWPALTNDWSAFYTFNTDAREHFGVYNGTLKNHAAVTNDASFGNVLNLDGVTNYVTLPDPIANCRTIMTWVKWNGGSAGQHLFDFGTDVTNYFYLTPQSTNGVMSFGITTNSTAREVRINAPIALPTNTWCHVAVTLDGTQGLLYLDGALIASNSSLTLLPWLTGWESAKDSTTEINYIGKSKFSGAPLFGGEISSFRIFGRALTAAEIQSIATAPPSLAHRYSFASNEWESISMAHGTLMGNATITNHMLQLDGVAGDYLNLPGNLVTNSPAVTLEFWASFGANGSGAHVVDFGNISGSSGQDYLSFSPHDDSGGNTLEENTAVDTLLASPGTFDNTTVQVACIVDTANHYGAVYTNGILENSELAIWPALTSVSGAWSFVGRSLFSSDSYLNATIDELRIYDGRLTPQQIATDYQLGPSTLGPAVTQGTFPALGLTNAPGGLSFSWPSWAVGFSLQYSTNLASGIWAPVPQTPALTNGQFLLNLALTNPATFYRLQR
jgi:arabinan endo-1,5-alpha-L-arabinosidase